jgi:hypothetical protein
MPRLRAFGPRLDALEAAWTFPARGCILQGAVATITSKPSTIDDLILDARRLRRNAEVGVLRSSGDPVYVRRVERWSKVSSALDYARRLDIDPAEAERLMSVTGAALNSMHRRYENALAVLDGIPSGTPPEQYEAVRRAQWEAAQ